MLIYETLNGRWQIDVGVFGPLYSRAFCRYEFLRVYYHPACRASAAELYPVFVKGT